MQEEQLRRAWDRNGEWVRRRYPELTDRDLGELETLGVIPLPTGEVSIPPNVVLGLQRQIEAVAARVTTLQRQRRRQTEDGGDVEERGSP